MNTQKLHGEKMRKTNQEMKRINKVPYHVKLDRQPLEMIKMISKVENESTSCLIRRAIQQFCNDWHSKKKKSILNREKDFKEIQLELNGWTGASGERWIENDESW